jgi:NADPH:quinone reductase-like Zn-dependent oxidoreductase
MVSKAGALKNLKLQHSTIPAPANGEVCVEVHCIGLNFADIFAIEGLYSATPKGAFVPGLEFSGSVVAIGSGVKNWKRGDAVMGVSRFSAYTTHLCIEENYLFALPAGWSFAEGAAYPVQVLTAWYALIELGGLKEGQRVLIHSGAGGVGIWANRIARWKGASTIGTVGRVAKLKVLTEEGFGHGIVRSSGFSTQLNQTLNGEPLHLVLDPLGGKIFSQSYKALAPEGRIITFGSANFATGTKSPNYLKILYNYLSRPRLDPLEMISDNKAVMGFNLIWLYYKADKMRALLEESLQAPLGKPRIGITFPFEEMKEALLHFKSGRTTGKVVIEVKP